MWGYINRVKYFVAIKFWPKSAAPYAAMLENHFSYTNFEANCLQNRLDVFIDVQSCVLNIYPLRPKRKLQDGDGLQWIANNKKHWKQRKNENNHKIFLQVVIVLLLILNTNMVVYLHRIEYSQGKTRNKRVMKETYFLSFCCSYFPTKLSDFQDITYSRPWVKLFKCVHFSIQSFWTSYDKYFLEK